MNVGYLFIVGATDFIIQVREIVSKIIGECQGPIIAKTILKKSLKLSHYMISQLNTKLWYPRECGIGVT